MERRKIETKLTLIVLSTSLLQSFCVLITIGFQTGLRVFFITYTHVRTTIK